MLIASLALFCVLFYMILFLYSSSVAFFSFVQQSFFCEKVRVHWHSLCSPFRARPALRLSCTLRYYYRAGCTINVAQGARLAYCYFVAYYLCVFEYLSVLLYRKHRLLIEENRYETNENMDDGHHPFLLWLGCADFVQRR